MNSVFIFMAGYLTAAFLVISLIFLGFWKKTRDSLFVFFCSAFAILAIERIVVLIGNYGNLVEELPQIYLLRLAAFFFVIFGILQKNKKAF